MPIRRASQRFGRRGGNGALCAGCDDIGSLVSATVTLVTEMCRFPAAQYKLGGNIKMSQELR
jgi:hypothetical protein